MGCWHRQDNQTINRNRHAEVLILEKYLNKINGDKFRVEMAASFSPCIGCSNKLLDFKTEKRKVEVKIRIANFYNHHKKETELLPSLIKNGFELLVFNGEEEWVKFYTDINGFRIDEEKLIRDHYQTVHEFKNRDGTLATRRNREKYDSDLLENFKVTAQLIK